MTRVDLLRQVFSAVFFVLVFSTAASEAQEKVDAQYPQIKRINELVQKVWDDYQLKPSEDALDGEWCRRVYLDLVGRIPTVPELQEFVDDRDQNKKLRLVEKLLYDDQYTLQYARNWTTIWSNLLIGRTGGTNRNSMTNRDGMQKFLRDSFARNKPYDKIVYELVTAAGTTTPGADDFNGATNFLIDKVNDENGSLATAATTRLFLGLQVQCTQCHNHPFNDWKQQKYWEMNAFFRQARAFAGGMRRGDGGPARLADQDYRGESGNSEEADLFFELRNGVVQIAFPVFVNGTEIPRHGHVNVVNRRKELARLICESEFFDRAIANRMWAHFLGYGFTNPIDDLGPHNIPTNPELLVYLGSELRGNDYDLRSLMTWIVLSKPYALSSRRTTNNQSDDPQLGEPPKFSQFYLRQMRAEELYESLLVATEASNSLGNYEQQEARKNSWLQQFSQAFGTDEGDETTTFNGTIPQVLMMFNGDLIRAATSNSNGNLVDRLAKDATMKDKDRIEYLFQAGLARKPNRRELVLARQFFAARSGNTAEALRDLWWVVLNSNEFIFNH